MIFAHPWWLLAGLVACGALLWVWRRYDRRQRAALADFVAPHLHAQLTQSISGAKRFLQRGLFAASVGLLFVALAGPQAGYRWEQITGRGNDIIFAVDTSRSMLTPDVKPNRLVRAKLAIDDFVSRLNGDAVGLVAFAGSAFLECPMTLDYGAFHESLSALDTHIIPRGGTNIASAIREAQAALQRRPNSDKVLILVTDGEDLEGDSLAAAKAAAKQDGLKIFTVGVGTANGDLIPLPVDQGGGFLKDSEGHLVKSRLDESALRALAAATGGSYSPLGAENQGLETIYQQALAPLVKHDLESRTHKVFIERYQWPLGSSLALLVGSLMLGTRRRVTSHRSIIQDKQSLARYAAPTSAALLGLFWLLPIHSAHASPASAAEAYRHCDFSKAERDYSAAALRNPNQPILRFDEGAAAYKAGEFPQAAQAFRASVNVAQSGSAKRLAEQEDAYYNLGNSLYREGQKTERGNPQETVQHWTLAVKAYDAALQLRAGDSDSKFNRDFVNRKLEALKKVQAQQNQFGQSSRRPQQLNQQQDQERLSKDNSSQPTQQQHAGQSKRQPKGQPQQRQQQAGGEPSNNGQKNPRNEGAGAIPPDQVQQAEQRNQPSAAPNGSLPQPDLGQGNVSSQRERAVQVRDEQRVPGQMSREEARELLDSVRDEERRLPAAPLARNGAADSESDAAALKNW